MAELPESLAGAKRCSTFVLMDEFDSPPARWPRPPACLFCSQVGLPPAGMRVAVAGLVLVRQRPGTANGVVFITLEDESGTCNVVVWRSIYEKFRRAVIAGRCLRVTGRLQREAGVTHLIAEEIEDISAWLDDLLCEAGNSADADDADDSQVFPHAPPPAMLP